mmetsp:Transcript_136097/g.434556  ORF Transcript_136097/g.434556 Transcript_136097/m.434556 type:complete len:118 (+) Transcript_136097:1041-1394(+)
MTASEHPAESAQWSSLPRACALSDVCFSRAFGLGMACVFCCPLSSHLEVSACVMDLTQPGSSEHAALLFRNSCEIGGKCSNTHTKYNSVQVLGLGVAMYACSAHGLNPHRSVDLGRF